MASSINADNGVSSGSAGLKSSADSSGVLQLQTNGTTALSIDASQNVSFTNQPTYTGGTANGVAYLNGSKVLTTGSALVFDGTNLGVGVTPSAWGTGSSTDVGTQTSVHYSGSVGALFGKNVYYNAGYKYKATGTARAYVQDDGGHSWSIAASGTAGNAITFTQAMTLDTSSNWYLGKTTADITNYGTHTQSSGSTIYITSNNTYSLQLTRRNGTGQFQYFNYNGTDVGTISTNGSATAYNTTSDYRLKENIAPMTGALATVAQLKPCTYSWKSTGEASQGFIAHELQAVVPDAVTGEKDAVKIEQYEISPAVPATFDEEGNELTPAVEAVMGEREVPAYQGIDTSFLVATLTAAIQEQQAIITQLQADVAALKGASA